MPRILEYYIRFGTSAPGLFKRVLGAWYSRLCLQVASAMWADRCFRMDATAARWTGLTASAGGD
jgi:hypothetical protein